MTAAHTFASLPDYTDDYASCAERKGTLTVKDMEKDEQPRERARLYGVESLTNAELFALILRTGTRGYPITDLCRDLMKMNENLIGNLERNTREQLMKISGVGELKALQIMAVMEIVRRSGTEKVGERIAVRTSSDIFDLMRPVIGNIAYEEIWVLFMNRANRLIGKMRVSSGGSSATVFDIKKILKNAILCNAESLAMCHNHPSGNLQPSGPDDNITRRFKEGCEKLDMACIDHLIITGNGYYSYRDQGRII